MSRASPRSRARRIRPGRSRTSRPRSSIPGCRVGVAGYRTSRGGTGLVQPVAVDQVAGDGARPTTRSSPSAINFGFEELKDDFSKKKKIKLHNNGSTAATFNVAQANAAGVAAHGQPQQDGRSPCRRQGRRRRGDAQRRRLRRQAMRPAFQEVAGLVQFTPATATDNAGVTLRVPYYLVPRAKADIIDQARQAGRHRPVGDRRSHQQEGRRSPAMRTSTRGGSRARTTRARSSNDIRAVGVQSFGFPSAADPNRALIVFAVNTRNRWSNASVNEFDIGVDVDNDGVDDYVVVGVDQGAVQTGTFNGIMGSFVFSTRSAGASIAFLADAATDGSTALLPVLSIAALPRGRTVSQQDRRTRAHVQRGRLRPQPDGRSRAWFPASAKFNVWNNAISTGGFATVAPGDHGHEQRDPGQLGRMGVDACAGRDGRDDRQQERARRGSAHRRQDQEVIDRARLHQAKGRQRRPFVFARS